MFNRDHRFHFTANIDGIDQHCAVEFNRYAPTHIMSLTFMTEIPWTGDTMEMPEFEPYEFVTVNPQAELPVPLRNPATDVLVRTDVVGSRVVDALIDNHIIEAEAYMQLHLDEKEHDVRVYEMTGIAVAWLRARKLV